MRCNVVSAWVRRARRVLLAVGLAAGMTALAAHSSADGPAGTWAVAISTAPQLPQDVWFAGRGNNTDGWESGGSICIGHLAQGFEVGQHIMLLTDIVEGGLIGVDGSPVEPGTYTFPSEELGDVDYTVVNGRTFYVVLDIVIVNSNVPGFNVGDRFQFIYMFDYTAGRSTPNMFLWIDFGFGFIPFLNEGVMMSNIQFRS